MQRPRLNYVATLKQTLAMLSDPNGARADTTLVTVLFLNIFEKLAKSERGREAKESRGWAEVRLLDGAMALLKYRGEKQFDNWLGMIAFQQLRSGVLTNCLEREVEVPAPFTALRTLAARSRKAIDVRWRFEETVVRLISLKAGMKSGMIRNEQSEAMARELDHECLELCQQASPTDVNKGPSVSNYRTRSTTTDPRILNHLYIIRLVLAEITPHSSISSHTKGDMASICKAIYASATNLASFTAPQTFFVSTVRRSPLKILSYQAERRDKSSDKRQEGADAFKILRLVEKSENNALGSQKEIDEQSLEGVS